MKTLLLVISALIILTHQATAQSSTISGKVLGKDGDVMIMISEVSGRPYFALTNFPPEATLGKHLRLNAKKIGVYDWQSTPVELWDAKPPTPLPISSMIKTPSGVAPVTAAQEAVILENQIKQIDAQIAALEQQRELKERQLEQVHAAMK